ncbi:MAG: S8 family serine peptidase, partial [Coriobacteriia bacterium]|nr:S8 family serine peptidase [Coriobacteriia bacterium]
MKKLRFLIVSALAACLVFAGVLLFGPVSPESQAEPLEQQADYIEVLSDILEDTEFIDNARQAAVDFDLVPGVEYVADEVIVVFSKTVTVSEAATLLGAFDGVSAEAITQESLLSPNTVVLKIAEGMSVADAIAELQNLPEIAFSQPNFIYRHLFDLDELEALLPENEALPMDDESLLAADELVTPEEDVQANGEVLEFDASELEALKDLDALAVTINDPQRNNQWALASSRAYDAWGLAQTNRRVTVAVIDSGVRTTHEDLVNNIVPGSYRDVTGRGVTGDVTGHGTHVAGIIAAQANNGLGVAGISYNARIIPINVFYAASGEYTSNTSMVVAAYDYLFTGTLARDTNLKVINMSLGGVGSDSLVESRINGAYNLGVLTVCAAGNNNSNDLVYPGAYSNCINVANLQRGTGVLNDVRNPTSNWGNTIDISAPGTLILSTTYGSNSSYGYMTGTSMASPFVAGIAALLFAAEPRATPAQVRSALFNTAKDLGAPGKDIYYGWGQVNPYDALIFMKDLYSMSVTASVSSNQMNASIRVTGAVLPMASSVLVPVWRSANQSDLIWYPAQRQSDGSWIATVNIANHRLAGTYNAHVYATISGIQSLVASTTFNITTFTPTIAIQNNAGTTFDVVVSSLTPSGLSAVRLGVWSTSNQSNLAWYTATRQTNGSYRATVNIANHGFATGVYQVHAYATAGNGVPGNMAAATATTNLPPPTISATVSSNQMNAQIKVSGG